MAKTKNKEAKELEYFKGQIRKLESENRQLKRRLRSLDKRSHFYDGLIDAVAEDIKPETDLVLKCDKCKVGTIKLVDVKYAKFYVCDNPECQHREKA
jgi:ribosomal protein L44E